MGWESALCQSVIRCIGKVCYSVQESAVKIKYYKFLHIQTFNSEWVSYRKMKCGIPFPSWMNYWPSFLIHGRIMSFQSKVKPQ